MEKTNTRILVVEDDPTLQYLVQRQLKELGYFDYEVAANGLIAVEKSMNTSYDIILMDVMMPVLDGLHATQRIRQAEQASEFRTPIVGMTAFADSRKCLEAGMDSYLLKPVMLEHLQSALRTHLGASHLRPKLSAVALPKIDHAAFEQNEQRLDQINSKIEDLRKRFGLA